MAASTLVSADYHCPACGQQTFLRPIDLSGILIFALRRIGWISEKEKRPAIADDMAKLGRSTYCNYSALKYWGFIRETLVPAGWAITNEGKMFLAGAMRVPKRLWIFDDRVRSVDERELGQDPSPDVSVNDVREYVPKTRQTVRDSMVAIENQDADRQATH